MALTIPIYWLSPELGNITNSVVLSTLALKYGAMGIFAILDRGKK